MMRTTTRSHLVALAVALALASGAVGAADKKGPQTIGDLKAKQVEVKKDTQVSATSSKAMDNYKRFLELQKTDPEKRAEAMRRLGDLNLEAGEIDRMATEVTAVDIQGGEAIKLYSTLLKA